MFSDGEIALCLCSIATMAALGIAYAVARRDRAARRGLVVLSAFACVVYLCWRATVIPWSRGPVSIACGIVLFAAEFTGVLAFFSMLYLFSGTYKLEPKTLADFKGAVPFVDVLICTYNEPLYLLRMTIAAACNLDYPADRFCVHVCDDGGREELRRMCEDFGVDYLAREGNEGAKAGNLNHAIGMVEGDLFAVLDADMVPTRDFLARTAGYFCDENLSFVQTPQVYYNQDAYQYNLNASVPNEQDFFMREVQEARASRNAVLHVGTNAVFRRSAVLAVGGYPTCSITEDMALSEILQGAGYGSLLVNEELVYGLSATTFSELVKQRDRWCRGNLQVLKLHNPLTYPGLTFAQRVAYADGALYWYSNLQKMVYLLCPVLFFLTGIVVIDAPLPVLFAFFFPFLLGQQLVFSALTSKMRSMRWSHYYDVAMAPHLSMSIIKETLGVKAAFNVTAKDTLFDAKIFHARIVAPHLVLLALTVIGWGLSAAHVVWGGERIDAYLMNYAWSAYNALGLVNAVRVANQLPLFRRTERLAVSVSVPALMRRSCNREASALVMLRDISGEGVGVELSEHFAVSVGDKVGIQLGGACIPCVVVRSDGVRIALRFEHPDPVQMRCAMRVFQDNLHSHHDVQRHLA